MRRGEDKTAMRAPLVPIATLQLGAKDSKPSVLGQTPVTYSISSLCFISSTTTKYSSEPDSVDFEGSSASDESSDEDLPLNLRTQRLVEDEARGVRDITASARRTAAAFSLSGRFLASCQVNGDCLLWDLGRRQRLQSLAQNRGPGLLLRRIDESDAASRIMYQTRNEAGTVSLHDMESAGDFVKSVASVNTYSRTFCTAAPSRGNPNLVALPSEDESAATIHDWRMNSQKSPLMVLFGAGAKEIDELTGLRKHGMLTSLAFVEDASGAGILACGMESGSLFLHDLRITRQGASSSSDQPCGTALAKDPILSLDMTASQSPENKHGSVVVIAGMAGDAAAQSELPLADRGTVAVLKSTLDNHHRSIRLRARLATCEIGEPFLSGKPGISVCRFRPDGRIFAVGGWDYRLRIFDRSRSSAPLALLRGHSASVNAMDWSSDADVSGLLATGGADGQINVWRCFSKVSKA